MRPSRQVEMAPHLRSVVAGALGPSSTAPSAAPPPPPPPLTSDQREPNAPRTQPSGPSPKKPHLPGPSAAPVPSEEQAPPLDSWEEMSSDDGDEEEPNNEAELPGRPGRAPSDGPPLGPPPGLGGAAQATAAQRASPAAEPDASEENERMRLEQERAAGTPTVMADAAVLNTW